MITRRLIYTLAFASLVCGSVAVAGPPHDFTGDGKSDVLVRNENTGRWYLFPLDGRQVTMGAHRGPVKLTSKLVWQSVGVADFTGDNRSDLLIRNTSTGQWFLYPLDVRFPVRNADRGPVKLTGLLTWEPVAVVDFTGNGRADVLVRHTITGRWYLYPLSGRQLVAGPDLGPVALPDLSWQLAAAADFTGDGKADLLVRNENTGEWLLYPMNGRTVVKDANNGSVDLPTDLDWKPVGAGDFTGDGKADMLIRNLRTGEWSLYPMDGRAIVTGVDRGTVDIPNDLTWYVQQVEDFTGDGKVDILVRNVNTGLWHMYPMDGRFVVDSDDDGAVAMSSNMVWQTVVNPPELTQEPLPPLPTEEVPEGRWRLRITCDETGCGEGVSTETVDYTIERLSDTQLEIRTPNGVFPGAYRDGLISWSAEFPEDGGTLAETGTIRLQGDSASGQSSWTWSDGQFACEGTCSYEATRLARLDPTPPPPVAVVPEGTWDLRITCDQTGCGEGVSVETVQYTIVRLSSSELQIRTPRGEFRAAFRDDLITWTASYAEDGGTTTENGSIRIEGDSAAGQSSWTWSDGQFACSGTCTYTATRR